MELYTKVNKINKDGSSNDKPMGLKLWRKIVRIVIIALLFIILTFSYVFLFSGFTHDGMIGTRAVGVYNQNNFVDANLGDLICIEKINKISEIQIGQTLVYELNGGVFSGIVEEVDAKNKVITICGNDQKSKLISKDVVIGLQGKRIAVLGYIWGFCVSGVGVGVMSLVLLAYLFFITFSSIKREETQNGLNLLAEYKRRRQEEKARKKLIKLLKRTDGFEYRETRMLDGTMGDNLIELISATTADGHLNVTEAYDCLLEKVYKTYIAKETLSRIDRTRISNVIELSGVVEKFSDDLAYKLIDLILKETVHDFDTAGYEKLCQKFMAGPVCEQDMINFGNVLFTLIKKNPKIKNARIKKIVFVYTRKVREYKNSNIELEKIAEALKNLFTYSN